MDKINVQVELAHDISAIPAVVVRLDIKEESEAARKLKLALKVSAREHTYSIAQLVGIYPA